MNKHFNPTYQSKITSNQILDFSIQYTTHPPTITFDSSVSGTFSFGPCGLTASFRKEYIEGNLAELEKQIATGEGGHITSLAVLSGCDSESERLGQVLQRNFVETGSVLNLGDRMNDIIQSDQILVQKCRVL